MQPRRPKSTIMVAFKGDGKIDLNTPHEVPILRGMMKGDEEGEIVIKTTGETLVKIDPRAGDDTALWKLTNEEVHFNVSNVLFFSLSEVVDAPRIAEVGGVVDISGRRM